MIGLVNTIRLTLIGAVIITGSLSYTLWRANKNLANQVVILERAREKDYIVLTDLMQQERENARRYQERVSRLEAINDEMGQRYLNGTLPESIHELFRPYTGTAP